MRYKRRIFLIDKKFQLRFSLFVCSWVFALNFVYPFLIKNIFDYFFQYLALDPNGPQLSALQKTRGEMLTLLVVMQWLFTAITFLISIFVSHRIAGPMFKLKKFMIQASTGKFESLRFRESDHFKDVAVDFNTMIDGIKTSKDKATEATSAALVHIEKALNLAKQGQDPVVTQELESALKTLQQI